VRADNLPAVMVEPTPPRGPIITIDGPAGAGKSSVARRLADRLGMRFLDTGAMYRGVAAAVLDAGADPADPEEAAAIAAQLHVRFNWDQTPPGLRVDGRDVTHRLRDPHGTDAVSRTAATGRIRALLVRAQRKIAHERPGLVTEGRDQGSVVFPDATIKFYLDASPRVRARRRAEQLRAAGQRADEAVILEQIRQRDHRDSTRRDGPLIQPDDAVVIDSSAMTLDAVVEAMAARAERVLAAGRPADMSGGPG